MKKTPWAPAMRHAAATARTVNAASVATKIERRARHLPAVASHGTG